MARITTEVVTIPQVAKGGVTEERAHVKSDVMMMANGGSMERGLISGEAARGGASLGHRFAAAWVQVRAAFGDG